jgi:ribosomal protein L40E
VDLPISPSWLSPLILVVAIGLIATYSVAATRQKTERCPHCGAMNPLESAKCAKCGGSTYLTRQNGFALAGALVGMLLGMAPLMLLLLSVQNYPDPPVPELIVVAIGIAVFIAGFVVLVRMPARRMRLKQHAAIHHTDFYGGYCAKCGTEMLGGWEECPTCGWKVSADKPNWAIASKNGKTLPQVDLKVICHKCQAENLPSATVCKKCKANLLSYESVWQRLGYFVVSILFSLGAGWLAFRIFENPELDEGFSALGFGMISLVLIAVGMPIWGLYRAFSHGSLTELLTERAGRQNKTQPWQALEDLGHALELAPIQEHAQIMTMRMSLYSSLGLMQNATREELAITYAKERNPQGGMGLFIAGNMFGDSFSQGYLRGISKQARKDREKMYTEGRAIVVGYCPVCMEAIELNNEFKCPNSEKASAPKHSGKPKFLQYVVAADLEAGKAAVLKAKEAGDKVLRSRIVTIVTVIIGAAALCSLFNYLTSL